MTFAFQRETRDRAVRSIANLRNFRATRGSSGEGLEGISGPCRRLTNSRYGALPPEYAHGLDDAQYVVYCYGTPIAWVTMADDATEEGRINFMPDWQYSATTTYYQGLVWEAWGDGIVDPDPAYTRQAKADKRAAALARRRAARMNRPDPGSEGRAIRGETAQQTRMAQLLDPRYRDPDWTPEPLPERAEERDWARVRASQDRRYPSHP